MFGGMADHWNVPMCDFDPSGKYDCEHESIRCFTADNTMFTRRVDHIHFGRHSTDIVADFTADFIRNHNDDAPFFTYTSFLAPHDPRTMPRELLAPYPRSEIEVRRHIAEYYAMITHLDDAIGRILTAVEETGQYDNTIFVFAGDNGLAVGRHGLLGKQNHYEHSIRVPLIIAGPGVPKRERRDTYAYLLDIYPTLCDLTGIEIPASVEGRSLVPTMTDPAVTVRDDLYFAYGDLIRSVKDGTHKLVLYSHGGNNFVQLFDVVNDPDELNNKVAIPDGAMPTARLYELILDYRDEWGDRETKWGAEFWDRFEANGGLDAAVRNIGDSS